MPKAGVRKFTTFKFVIDYENFEVPVSVITTPGQVGKAKFKAEYVPFGISLLNTDIAALETETFEAVKAHAALSWTQYLHLVLRTSPIAVDVQINGRMRAVGHDGKEVWAECRAPNLYVGQRETAESIASKPMERAVRAFYGGATVGDMGDGYGGRRYGVLVPYTAEGIDWVRAFLTSLQEKAEALRAACSEFTAPLLQ